jgi:hypothetical protein
MFKTPIPQVTNNCLLNQSRVSLNKPLLGGLALGLASLASSRQGLFYYPNERETPKMLSQFQFKVVNSTEDDLEKLIHNWLRDAVFFIGGSWYTHKTSNKDIKRLEGVSGDLRLRWILGRSTVKVSIEQNSNPNGSNWLSGYRVGDFDPFAFEGFTHHYDVTDHTIELVEGIVIKYLPQIEIVRCYFCEGRFSNIKDGDTWCCHDCGKAFVPKKDTSGFVYVFGSVTNGYYKIGCSNMPTSRMGDYKRSKLPFSVEMIHKIPADDKRQAEAELHRLFREKHTNGEWYKLTDDDVTRITSLKKYVTGRWIRK